MVRCNGKMRIPSQQRCINAILAVTVIGTCSLCRISTRSPAQASAQASPAAPAVSASPEIAAALAPIIKEHDIPGMIAAIVEGDGTIEIGCAGVRAIGSPQAITITDRMHLGSCTKSMTATMLATLVGIGPAGIVHCSLVDWSKYASLHLRGARGNDTAILKSAAFKDLHTPARKSEGERGGEYAMGWGVTQRPWAGDGAGGTVLTHNGSNTMWFAVCWLAPERDFAVLVACNKGGDQAAQACDEAAAALIKRHRERLSWP